MFGCLLVSQEGSDMHAIGSDTEQDRFALLLGKIMNNLLSLEFVVRLFLHEVEQTRYGWPPRTDVGTIKAGDVVPESYLTNYESLGKLIDKYNAVVQCRGAPDLRVDRVVVVLRDALAHGRMLSDTPLSPPRLYKFGKPKERMVPVDVVQDLTEGTLSNWVKSVLGEVGKVVEAHKRFRTGVVG